MKVQDFQQALQGYVQKHGIGKLPVDYEELRPLLMAMQRVAERRGIEVVVFDKRIFARNADLTLDDKFWVGLIVPVASADEMKVEIEREYPGAQVLAEPYSEDGLKTLLYNSKLTVTVGALGPKH